MSYNPRLRVILTTFIAGTPRAMSHHVPRDTARLHTYMNIEGVQNNSTKLKIFKSIWWCPVIAILPQVADTCLSHLL